MKTNHDLLRYLSEEDKADIVKKKDTGKGKQKSPGETYWKNWKTISRDILNDAVPAWNKVVKGSISGEFSMYCYCYLIIFIS